MADYREKESDSLRVLFCLGVTQSFFEQDPALLPTMIESMPKASKRSRARLR